ncbi:arginase family protein [bacterium]|nr:arginase family protein [bacterium]
MDFLQLCTAEELRGYTSERPGEVKAGQRMRVLNDGLGVSGLISAENFDELSAGLASVRQSGAEFALVGVPEDITPRANQGRGGADGAWQACLKSLANLQHNRFLDFSRLLVLGTVPCDDLKKRAEAADTEALRKLCSELDVRLASAVRAAVSAGLIPIVVGGGHGGAYGIMRGAAEGNSGYAQGIAAINCDPHADYRLLEGRHSGNGFSYARHEGWLRRYHVLGLHESYNSEAMLQNMERDGVSWIAFEDIFVRGQLSWAEALRKSADLLKEAALPVGLELDLDSVAGMPSSAMLPYGLSLAEAAQYIGCMASSLPVAYLHLAEGAPALAGDGDRTVGRALAWLIAVFCKSVPSARAINAE